MTLIDPAPRSEGADAPQHRPLPTDLGADQIEEFGREIHGIYLEAMDSRGDSDMRYIRKVIRTQRNLAFWGRMIIFLGLFFMPNWSHPLASWTATVLVMGIGVVALGTAKILENMEIAHNVLHGQWDWMKDPDIQSNTWEWDNWSPSDRWMNSHNVVHHTWTNVVGRDLDVGYGIMRVTTLQKWSPKFLVQPVYFILLMLFFQEGVALHEQAITDLAEGKGDPREARPLLRHIGRKAWGQVQKDYIMWPALGAAVAFIIQLAPIPDSVLNAASPWQIFLMVAAANAVANLIRNVWAFVIIFCGHFPSGVFSFTEDQVQGETRGEWYLRQMLGSANISGGRFFHLMSGNLSHQIEHHLFPDLCSNRYSEVAPRVRAVADRYGLPYATGRLSRQFGSTWWNNLRLAFPGGPTQPEVAHARR